jgi:hypothetical protein
LARWLSIKKLRGPGFVDQIRNEGRARAKHEERIGFIDLRRTVIQQRVPDPFLVRCTLNGAFGRLERSAKIHNKLKHGFANLYGLVG